MKRIIYSLGLMLAATLTLTNCAKEIDAPVVESEGVPFEIVASTADTKTVNDGMSTKWEAEDQINLFHAVAGSTTYVNDAAFTVKDAAAGLFEGELTSALEDGKTYDWYAFYPYKSFIETPAAQTDGYTYIGSRSDGSQAQVGVDNKEHIAGANYPLYGKDLSVAKEAAPEITMSHASALIEVKVTNTLDTELSVDNISFTATESVVGTFYPNIVGDVVAFSDGPYVSEVANLSVSNATIAAGATASFYLAVKPFTAVSGSELILAVNGDEKPLTMTKDVTFSAGMIKTLTFAYDSTEEPEGPEKLSIAEFCELPDGSTIYEVTGTITGIYQAYNSQYNNISFYLKDATGEMVVFRMSCVGIDDPAATITPGDQITVQGPKGNYNGVAQMAAGGKCISHIDASDSPVVTCVDNVVTITAEEGATIYYTINGDTPTVDSDVYSEPFTITESCTVNAIALIEGKVQSPVSSAACIYEDPTQEKPEEASYTIMFGANYNSKKISSYTDTWNVTYEGFKCEMKNWNNNNNAWNYVKAGRKNYASVATITTTSAIEEAMTKVAMTVDAVTVAKINSLKLYVASTNDFSNADVYTTTPKQGEVVFTITSPAANNYYKIEVDCAVGTSNGLLTVSKVVYSNF